MPTIKELLVNGSKRRLNADAEPPAQCSARRPRSDGQQVWLRRGSLRRLHRSDQRPADALCKTPVADVRGKKVRTIEGMARGAKLHPLQEAFLQAGALQCGYCTSGMIMSALALLAREPEPSRADIVRALNGNICRCGIYPRIVTAVEQAAKALKGGGQ